MGSYYIQGGIPLRGTVPIHGAKNSVLPVLAASILAEGPCTVHNCPRITDVEAAVEILEYLGARTERQGDTLQVDTRSVSRTEIPCVLMKKMRAAVIFLGPLLGKFGRARMALPGGCPLGERPVDLHLRGLKALGARIESGGEELLCTAPELRGGTLALSFPSVGATENLILAALCAGGETVLCNCAREPEIPDLCRFLTLCGAEISGAGTSVIRIRGGRPLGGCEFTVMPDRMETATYLAAAAATRGSLVLRRACTSHLEAVIRVLTRGGCRILPCREGIKADCTALKAVSPIRTGPYPAFPTDAQAPVMGAMAGAEGISIFEETVFAHRFGHVPGLCAMGAEICTTRHCAVVRGVRTLHGAEARATDLRAGAALVIGALSARGESCISGTEHIDRGYQDFAANLRHCGAEIRE